MFPGVCKTLSELVTATEESLSRFGMFSLSRSIIATVSDVFSVPVGAVFFCVSAFCVSTLLLIVEFYVSGRATASFEGAGGVVISP